MAYGEVQGKTWRSPSIRGLSDSHKLAWSYLLSNQHSNMLGYYLLPLPYMADDLEWPLERAQESIEALERRGLIGYDPAAQVVFVCKYLKYNRLSSGAREKGALSRLEDMPESSLLLRLSATVNEWHPQLSDLRAYLKNWNPIEPLFGVPEESARSPRGDIGIDIDTEEAKGVEPQRPKMSKEDLTTLTEHYATIRGARPRGKAWLPIQQGMKAMVVDEAYTVDEVMGCMDRLIEWEVTWTINTVRKWIADFAAGKMPSKNGDRASASGTDPNWRARHTQSPEAAKIWEKVKAQLEEEMSSTSFETWFAEAIPVLAENGSLTLAVGDAFTKGGIERRFAKRIEELLGMKLSVVV